MGLLSNRFLLYHRLFLLPPFMLLALTCLYASSNTLSPFTAGSQRGSFFEDVQCISCESSSSLPYRSFLSRTLGTVPALSYINDIVLRHDVLNVEDWSSGAAQSEVSRRPTNELDKVEDEQARIEEPTNLSRSDEKLADDDEVSAAVYGDAGIPTEEIADNLVPSAKTKVDNSTGSETTSGLGDENVDSSVQAVEISSEKKTESLEASRIEEAETSVPADDNGESSVEVVELPSETKENFEGGDKENDVRLESTHLETSDEPVHTPIETNVSVTETLVASPQPGKEVEISKSGYEAFTEFEWSLQRIADNLAKTGLPRKGGNSRNEEDFDVNVPFSGGIPQGVPVPEERSCEGRHAYVYSIPSKFNFDLSAKCDLVPWFRACEYLVNDGMGQSVATHELNDRGETVLVPEGSWFLTHQYALEVTFHARLKHYPCLTTDVSQADLFFVPYYAGLDVARFQNIREAVNNSQRDELMLELMSWLEGHETWSRNGGIDHVFVMGKIGWDFRRVGNSTWGSGFLALPAMDRPTKVLIERDPWHEQDVGVPHPTFFHPKSDDEIRAWLAHVEQSDRRHLVSFAGMPRPNMLGNIRGQLIEQCLGHPNDCSLLRCVAYTCMQPGPTMNLFIHSHFCMQPNGDSPTRRSVFDSLVGGCIPVLFDVRTAYVQYPWHLPRNLSSFSVYIPSADVMSGKADIVAILNTITPEKRTAMRTRIIREIIPGLLYTQPGTKHSDFRDAFDISIEALFHRLANLRAEKNSG